MVGPGWISTEQPTQHSVQGCCAKFELHNTPVGTLAMAHMPVRMQSRYFSRLRRTQLLGMYSIMQPAHTTVTSLETLRFLGCEHQCSQSLTGSWQEQAIQPASTRGWHTSTNEQLTVLTTKQAMQKHIACMLVSHPLHLQARHTGSCSSKGVRHAQQLSQPQPL